MLRLILQRLLALVPLLFIVSVLTFSFTSLLPSDPVDLIIGDNGTQEQYELVRERLGMNQPVVVRYFQWLGKAVQGDLGTSFFNSVSVMGAVMQRLPVTLSLTAMSALIAILIGVAAGVAAALRPQSWVDRFATLGATFGQAVPNFWFGLILVAIFAVNLRWFPATGFTPITQSPWEWLRSVILPSIALGTASSAAIARQVRSAMVGVLQQDYIRAARAQGGVIGAFLEMTAIIQLAFETGTAALPKPIGLTIDYLRSGRPLDTYARAHITKQGRRVATVHAEAWQDDRGRPIAAAHGHFLVKTEEADAR